MNITIKTIPHDQQRYDTIGDWWFDAAGDLEIRISDMGNPKSESLVAVHELAEALLCQDRGITTGIVDAFDMQYGGHGEPGDDISCPYRREHFFASWIERLLAAELGVGCPGDDSDCATVQGGPDQPEPPCERAALEEKGRLAAIDAFARKIKHERGH